MANGAGPLPNQQLLPDVTNAPPALGGYPLLGTMAAWSDEGGKLAIANDRSKPPYVPQPLNPNWTTAEAPAIAVSFELENVYVAWTDLSGTVRVASTRDGFGYAMGVSVPGTSGGPSILVADRRVYVAWRDGSNSLLRLAIFDGDFMNLAEVQTGTTLSSRPTLAWSSGKLYALCGGNPDGTGERAVQVFVSENGGTTFSPLNVQSAASFGPPSMAVTDGRFELVWADDTDKSIRYATGDRLDQLAVTRYSDTCPLGGPVIVGQPNGSVVGWAGGIPDKARKGHPIIVGRLPPVNEAAAMVEAETRITATRARRIAEPTCGAFEIYDPAEGKCVSKGGCFGGCVLESIDIIFGYPIFNPAAYALCVVVCKSEDK